MRPNRRADFTADTPPTMAAVRRVAAGLRTKVRRRRTPRHDGTPAAPRKPQRIAVPTAPMTASSG
ncbi:MAG: hypothetical protein BGO45_09085 [Microbacterium sp. 71-36]|nr:MAG: hypothetical protein ABS60_13940 [Microbacterium sp. SCN 71-17]OJV76969.1 MAG: hypothetical protein BGO45_09085 [Microbacterium sp. 71-36]